MIKNWLRALNRKRLQARKRRAMLSISNDVIREHLPFRLGVEINVLTPIHTLYIARQLVLVFESMGKAAQITLVKPGVGWGSGSWIVICPQAYEELPPKYVAYQLEQSGSSKHFTEEYFRRLRCAVAVWDYSSCNVDFLKRNGIDSDRVRHVPVTFSIKPEPLSPRQHDYDVAFYGDVNNPRRKKILSHLNERFNLKVVSGLYGPQLYAQLERARCVINIHYYEDALFETTRVFECLSRNICVVSEASRDQDDYQWLDGVVDFVPVDDLDAMVAAIRKYVEGGDGYCFERSKNSNKILMARENELLLMAPDLLSDVSRR